MGNGSNKYGSTISETDRFWAKVDRRGPDECWPWTAAKAGRQCEYGQMWFRGRLVLAHRIALILDGRDPGTDETRHSCDNPPCCNPAHLGSGTHAINMGEMVERGRSSRGQDRPSAKLTDRDVRAIRRRYAAGGVRQRDLADDYGVVQSLISRVINGHIWGHVA